MKKIMMAAIILLLAASPSWAVLGGTVQSVRSDQQRMRGELRAVSREGYSVQQITSADGALIKEYVSPAGVVFGVSWQSPAMPNLSQLLGAYFPAFQKAARSTAHRRRALVVRQNDLVVESGGHMRALRGRAYVLSLIPANLSPEVVQ